MDRRQLLDDPEAALRVALDGRQAQIWTALPCIVESVDLTKMTISAQPAIQGVIEDETGVTQSVNLPLLVDVPLCFPSAGGFILTMPIKKGDEVLVVLASRCIDSWWQNGGIGRPMEARMHDLSDGFAIPGPRSQPKLPAGSISATDVELRNDAGTTYLSITSTGKIGFKNATTDLKSTLTDLHTLLNTFMTTLSGMAGGAAPATQAMIQAPAASAVTALVPVLAKIGALLK